MAACSGMTQASAPPAADGGGADAANGVDASPAPDDASDAADASDAPDASPSSSCPSTILFSTGTTGGLAFGPMNVVLGGLLNVPGPVTNYAGDVIFPGATLRALGDFAPSDAGAYDAGAGSDAGPGPADGAALAPWLGELGLIPSSCGPVDVTGREVTVHFYVALEGAGYRPSNGAYLGSYHGADMTYYADATATDVINSQFEHPLKHVFTAAEAADVHDHGLYLRLYAIPSASLGDVPIRLSVSEIDWQ